MHVGGTNGKGSVAVLAYRALREAGYSVGLYTSPHLVDVRERMVVDDRPISGEAFAAWTERLRSAIDRTGASFFEATTVMALADFAARGVDLAVVEVGLGGRLDSTNVVDPLASVVTTIALEHTQYLGETLEAIAREKAGIAKPGVPFVTGEPDATIRAVLLGEATRRGASPVRAVETGRPGAAPLGLRGRHQWANAWVAVAALNELPAALGPPPADAIPPSFATAFVPGRFDVRGRWIFDVAHNPDGMAVMGHPGDAAMGPLIDEAFEQVMLDFEKGEVASQRLLLPDVVGVRLDSARGPDLADDRLALLVEQRVGPVTPLRPRSRVINHKDLSSILKRI